MKNNKCLQRTRSKFKVFRYYAFDIEYTRKEGVLLDACIGDEQQQDFYTTWEDIINALFEKSSEEDRVRFIVHAGNIAEYAHIIKFLRTSVEHRKTIEILPVYSGESMIAMQLKRGKESVHIIDLFALFPLGLKKIASVFAPEYPKLAESVDFEKRDYNPETDREYLRRDVQATVASYKNICTMIYDKFGVQPSMSAAGTAMKAWLYSLTSDKKYYRLTSQVEDFCREGYYGAYVHPGKDNAIHENVVSYDITAAYGARMRYKFPVGNGIYTQRYRNDKQGIWKCRVTCIDAALPIVPYRKRNGINWLGLAGDVCETTVTREEIEYFRTHGYTVEVLYGVYWNTSEYIFSDFIDRVEEVESISQTYKQCAKLMRNSLYGRFGTKKYLEKFVIVDKPTAEMIPYCDPHTGEVIEDLYCVEEELDVAYIQPHWAAYITAYQRLAMFDLIYQCGLENFLGCDTDSVKTYAHIITERNLPLSETEYGKGKIEASFDLYRSHGPKNYLGVHVGKYHAKSKGIPKKNLTEEILEQHLYRDEDTEIKVKYVSITKALTMLKKDGRSAHNTPQKRTLSALHSEKWQLVDNCFVPMRNSV